MGSHQEAVKQLDDDQLRLGKGGLGGHPMDIMGPPGKSGVAAHGRTMLGHVVHTARMWQSTRLLGAGDTDVTPMHLAMRALVLAPAPIIIGLANLLALARELYGALIDTRSSKCGTSTATCSLLLRGVLDR